MEIKTFLAMLQTEKLTPLDIEEQSMGVVKAGRACLFGAGMAEPTTEEMLWISLILDTSPFCIWPINRYRVALEYAAYLEQKYNLDKPDDE